MTATEASRKLVAQPPAARLVVPGGAEWEDACRIICQPVSLKHLQVWTQTVPDPSKLTVLFAVHVRSQAHQRCRVSQNFFFAKPNNALLMVSRCVPRQGG